MGLLGRIEQIARDTANQAVREQGALRLQQSTSGCDNMGQISKVKMDGGLVSYEVKKSDGSTINAISITQRPLSSGMSIVLNGNLITN